MSVYLIVPGCSDLNRGDQALVWETKRLAEEAGFKGNYYLVSDRNEPTNQSEDEGLEIVLPILEHPSRKYKDKNNIHYSKSLKIKWGIVALGDLIYSLILLWKPTRCIFSIFLKKEKKRAFNIMKSADAIFMKGGGLLQTYGGISATYSMYFWVYPIMLAHSMNIPVYVMPNSFGPFEGPLVKTIARNALKRCRLITSRENLSRQVVKEQLGIEVTNYADLAFQLSKTEFDKKTLFEKYDLPYDRKIVAITMRPYRFPQADNPEKAYRTFKEAMANFIEWLYKNGYMAVIVEHTRAVNAHENDAACIHEVVENIPNDRFKVISDEKYNCYDLKGIYSMFDYIIGTRFHSVIFSFGCNVPGIAVSYTGNKSIGIMKDIGMDDYVINIEDVSLEILTQKFSMMIDNEAEIKSRIKSYVEKSILDRNELKKELSRLI